jgi:hypothetical protein
MIHHVRTTLDIDGDLLQAAKELGQLRGKTAGRILSDLARQALEPTHTHTLRNGVPVLPRAPGARIITNQDVRRWLDEDD